MAYDRTIPGAVSPEREERLRAWAQRRPRVALMGEFSAGKSTLLNFLIEENLIPTRATATEVPPLWFSHGEGGAYWVDGDGVKQPITTAELGSVPMTARYVRVFSQAEILEHCDIVDTPGISDPNLAVESWRFAAGIANMVLWCSSATQAWRETERSAWLSLPERLRRHSVLIVTRADKLVAEGDRDKVQRRLARETAGLFRDRVFMATPDAVRAKAELADGETSPLWEASGAAALLDQLAGRFEAIYAERGALLRQRLTGSAQPVEPEPQAVEVALELEAEEESTGPRPTRPVRVQVGSPRRSERLRPEDADAVISKLRSETPPLAEAAAAVLGAGEEALRGIEPEATAEAAPGGTEAAAESPAVEEAFFGPDDDKDDRALREALGLDEPAAESGAAELAEAEAQAEAAEAADHGESEWDAKEEPEALADEAEAEPGVAMWDTAEEPEAAVEAVEAEPDLAGNAEEIEADAEEPLEAVADAEEPDEAAAEAEEPDEAAAEAEEPDEAVADAEEPDEAVADAEEPDEAVADAEERDEVEPEQAEAAAPSELPELMMARVMDWAAEEEAEAPAEEAPAAESGEAVEAGMADEAEPEQAEAAAPSETPELVMAQAIDWAAEEEAEAPDEAGEPEDVASEAESLAEAGAADDALAEAEAESETEAEEAGPAESAVEAERPYLLDAEHFVGAGRPQAAVPPAVRVWREIVARTELLPGNAQIAAMIEELLLVLEAEEAAPEAEAAAAPEPAVEADEVEAEAAGADDAADAERPEAEVVPGGWRRLA